MDRSVQASPPPTFKFDPTLSYIPPPSYQGRKETSILNFFTNPNPTLFFEKISHSSFL